MPKVAKKAAAAKNSAMLAALEPLADPVAPPPPDAHADALIEPRTPAHSPTRPHIGYFGRSSCPCWRCVRNMGPLQRRKECVLPTIALTMTGSSTHCTHVATITTYRLLPRMLQA